MLMSESWLREWVNPAIETKQITEQLTLAGLEVDGVEAVADFTGVVVGEIVACDTHPDADKLKVCQVQADEETALQIVCGAPNARVGIKVPLAKVNAVLPKTKEAPKGFKIKKAKLRGVESYGMLCGANELNIGEDTGGLMELPADAKAGQCLKDFLALNDQIIDIDLTPNRGDCLSVQGVAREISAINTIPLTPPSVEKVAVNSDKMVHVTLENDACSHYCGRVIEGLNPQAPTPFWMVEKLRRSGVRSIDAIVDVTNYVMLELGQPMHAFDLASIQGDITVKYADEGAAFETLDEKNLTLTGNTLVIADAKKNLALAGIMGGANSAINVESAGDSLDIFLESAFFNPIKLAGKARYYGLHTDSSHRFERGVDPQLQNHALERATQLIISICGGKAGAIVEAFNQHEQSENMTINLRHEKIESILGVSIPQEKITDYLHALNMTVNEITAGEWQVKAPSYRFDISREVDLIEEVARLYGYNNLEAQALVLPSDESTKHDESWLPLSRIEEALIGRDYQEVISYSFISPEDAELFAPNEKHHILLNPISRDLSVMRSSLLPGLINTVKYNLNRQHERVRLFETGLCFKYDGDVLQQQKKISGVIYGAVQEESWVNDKRIADFYDIKGDIEALFALGNESIQWEVITAETGAGLNHLLHPGQSALISMAGEIVGWAGALHPSIQKKLGIKHSLYIFELDTKPLQHALLPWFKPLSKFPEVRRDLAFSLNKDVQVAKIINIIKKEKIKNLVDCRVFDVYHGEEPSDKSMDNMKSIAIAFYFSNEEETLTDDVVNDAITALIAVLKNKFDLKIRA